MGFTQEQIELIDRAAAAAAKDLAQQAAEEAQYWSGLEAKLRELHAPAVFRALNEEVKRWTVEANSGRPSRATERIHSVRGELNGYVYGLAAGLGVERANVGTFWQLIRGLAAEFEDGKAYSEVFDAKVSAPSSLGL